MRANLIYEDRPRYDWWFKLVLGGTFVVILALGLWMVTVDISAAATLLGVAIFDGLLFYFVTPRSYQVYSDRLVIVLGRPLIKTVPFSDIKALRPASGGQALAYSGLKFTTSIKSVVEVQRYKGMNVVISPSSGDLFIEQVNQAMKLCHRVPETSVIAGRLE